MQCSLTRALLFICVALLVFITGCDGAKKPTLPAKAPARVNDYAGVLTDSEKQKLEAKLAQHENESSNQIAILIVTEDYMNGKNLRDFGLEMGRKWGIGQKDKDGGPNNNGVLIVYKHVKDWGKGKEICIEVGYGLEARLTDLASGEITDAMAEKIKAHKAYEAFDLGTTQIFEAVKGEYKNKKAASTKASVSGTPNSQGDVSGKHILGICLVVGCVVLVSIAGGVHHPLTGGIVGAASTGVFALIFVTGMWIGLLIIVGFLVGLIAKPVIKAICESDAAPTVLELIARIFIALISGGKSTGSFSGRGGDFGGGGASSDSD